MWWFIFVAVFRIVFRVRFWHRSVRGLGITAVVAFWGVMPLMKIMR